MLARSFTVAIVAWLALAGSDGAVADGPLIRQLGVDPELKTSEAVVVDGSLALVHTTQLLPVDNQGAVVHAGRLAEQTEAVLDRLEATLGAAHSGLDQLIKVNVYLAKGEDLAPFRAAFARRMDETGRPAVSHVVGNLADPNALVALDAVAAAPKGQAIQRNASKGFAVLPVGPRVYISGQAEPDEHLGRATAKTLKGLDDTLKFLAMDRTRVVQLKAFVQPMTSLAEVKREIATFFGEGAVPPLVFVEWSSGKTVPIEIELIVAGGTKGTGTTLEFLTPPELKPSPVFSRVARVNSGPLIYVSGLTGPAGLDGKAQTEAIFGQLRRILSQAGSDFRHMAKATYYVSDDPASRALNDLRPKFYDPARPPAASKAVVVGVGLPGRTITLDMIAVPAGDGESETPKSR